MWTVNEQDDAYYIEHKSYPPIARSNLSTVAPSQTRGQTFRRTPRKSWKKLNGTKNDGACGEEVEDDYAVVPVRRRKQPPQRLHQHQDPIHCLTLVNNSTGDDISLLKWLQQEDFSQSCFNIGDDLLVRPGQRPEVISHTEVMTSYEVSESIHRPIPAAEATHVMETESWDLDSFSSGLSFETSSSIFD